MERGATPVAGGPALPALLSRAATGYVVLATDPTGTVTAASAGAERALGRTADELAGATPDRFVDEAELAERAEELGVPAGFRALAGRAVDGAAETGRWTLVRPDGSRVQASLTVTPLDEPDGRRAGYLLMGHDLTADVRVTAERDRATRDLSRLFHDSPVPTVIAGRADARIRLANQAAADTLGARPADLVGRTTAEVGFWHSLADRQRALELFETEGRVRNLEMDVPGPEGLRTFVASLQPITFDDEPCVIGTYLDISARKRAEDALRESEARFRQLAESIDEGFLLRARHSTGFLYVSPGARRIFGLSAEEAARDARDWLPLVHPDDRAAVSDRLTRTRVDDRDREVEFRFTRPDGVTRWVRATTSRVEVSPGEEERLAVTVQDVTVSKEAEEALRASEERFRQLADNVDVGFFLRSVEPFAFLYLNDQVPAIYGVDRSTILADPPSVLRHVHPDDLPGVLETIRRTEQTGERQRFEYRVLRPGGRVRWVRVRLFPVASQERRPTRLGGIVEDVTDQKVAAEALRAAQREAEQANLAKSEFLSRMSHELRTPLNAVIGFSQLLRMDALTAEQREAVDHVLLGGRHLLELINEVLDISRIESGRLHLSLEPVRLVDVVEEALALVRPQAEAHRVTLPLGAGVGATVHVVADRQRLVQVLLNLLTNAVKYNRRDGRVEVGAELPDPHRVRITVRDTGVGVPEHRLADLFTPFERLGAEQSGVEGTGLGLALTQRLVELMHGTVSVASTVGEGTTVTVDLERCETPAPAAAPTPTRLAAGAGSARRVLYVEDNPANVRLLQRLLAERRGLDLHVAADGRTALERAPAERPDLVLLDVDLPDLDGGDVLTRLRADAATRHTPVVVVSADASSGQRHRLLQAGAAAYLTKPFDVEELLEVVDTQLARTGRAPADGEG